MSEEHTEETLPFSPPGESEHPPLDATQRIEISAAGNLEETGRSATQKGPKKGHSRWRWVFGSLAGLIVFIGLGALGGYQAGISQRQGAEVLERAKEAVIQFQYGEADLAAGHCDVARQRFEYVIQLNPNYPNLAERYAQSILCSTGDAAAGLSATTEATPTQDLRGAEELFSSAQALFAQQNWTDLMNTLDTLRKNYPDFMPIEGDGMYYIALRNRGYARIGEGDLEGGIYDLNRAEKIGPLDTEAQSLRQAASWYIIGQSFWEVDWGQAVQYFELVASGFPNLHDINFFPASERLAEARDNLGKQVVLDLIRDAQRLANEDQWCEAYDLILQAEEYGPFEPEFQPTADQIRDNCFAESTE
jgi:tetratricopeptide (TPR) repeat protein